MAFSKFTRLVSELDRSERELFLDKELSVKLWGTSRCRLVRSPCT